MKCINFQVITHKIGSLPLRGAWIEMYNCEDGDDEPRGRSPYGERRLKFNVCRQTLLGAEKIHMILMQREHKVSTRFVADIYA